MSVDDDVGGGEGGGGVDGGGEGCGGGVESHRPSSAGTVAVVVGAAATGTASSAVTKDDGAPAVNAAEPTKQQQIKQQPSPQHRPDKAVDNGGGGKGSVTVARPVIKPEARKRKKKEGSSWVAPEDETVRLLGEPLVTHGPYEFYRALAYRDFDEDVALKKKARRSLEKRRATGESCPCDQDDEEDDDDEDDAWTVVRMNHFYAVRPWYSKRNSCAADRQQMRQQRQVPRAGDRSPASRAAAKERREHHHQQSVCIGELELLWRDDTVRQPMTKSVGRTIAKVPSSDDDDKAVVGGGNHSVAARAAAEVAASAAMSEPRRRMLPRRTRQPSAKKIEAAESLAAAAAAAASDNHPHQQSAYRRKLQQTAAAAAAAATGYARSFPPAPWGDYTHGNLLCSVRLYVMPDQTEGGRLSGVHGEDEVLEINPWGANGAGANGVNGAGGTGVGSAYNGGAAGGQYGYGGVGIGDCVGSQPPSGCYGLVLRVEDFVEWVRGGLMDDVEHGDDDDEGSFERDAEVKSEYDEKAQQLVRVKEEQRQEDATTAVTCQRRRAFVDEALNAESVPLAAAKIFKKVGIRGQCRVADRDSTAKAVNGGDRAEETKAADGQYKDVKQCTKKNKKTVDHQRLVVMSYSRYCRYRAKLQRGQEELMYSGGGESLADRTNEVRVLFCRDTYDYPAELLLQSFNSQKGQQQNSSVFVNHMAPKLKGWPAHPASWMSFRWNRVRRRLRHMERGNGGHDEQRRRRRRRKLKKKSRQRQNGNSATTVVLGLSSSTDDGDSDESDTDGSSLTNDGATNTTNTSDSEGVPPLLTAVAAKTASKNLPSKENGSGHHNKKPLSVSTASSSLVVNGTMSTVAVNKRPAVVGEQSGQQQSAKRRRFVCPAAVANQPPQQQGVYQQLVFHPRLQQPHQQLYQQFNQLTQSQRQHILVAQQHQQSLNKRLPVPVSLLQPSTTRLIHHHLPPSVSIVPVDVSDNKNVDILQQQQQRSNNKLQNRPKPHATVSITQGQNNNSGRQQTSLSPVMVEYHTNRKHGSNDNGCHKNTTVAAAMAACHKRTKYIDFEDEQLQQQGDEEKQRRWLVDALRLGGLEVTAVPLKVNPNKSDSESSKVIVPVETSVQRKRERSHSDNEHPNSTVPVQNEQHQECSYDDSNQDSDTDSVVMTVTPDVVSLLNKSRQQQMPQLQTLPVSSSTSSTLAQKQQPSVTMGNVSSSNQNATGAAPALHDKITRAIDSLKKLQNQIANTSINIHTTDASSLLQDNNVSDSKSLEPRQRKFGLAGPPPRLIMTKEGYFGKNQAKSPVKPPNVVHPTAATSSIGSQRLSSAITINMQQQQQQQQQQLKRESASLPIPGKNLGISISPAITSTTTNAIKFQSQQQQKICTSTETRSAPIGGSDASLAMTVRQQLQRRIATGSSTVPALIPVVDNNTVPVIVTEPPVQHQIIVKGTPAAHASQTKQLLDDKINLQPKKKD